MIAGFPAPTVVFDLPVAKGFGNAEPCIPFARHIPSAGVEM